MSSRAPRIFLSAGEPSGDLHGAAVARALKQRWPDAQLVGLGGELMAAEGVKLQAHVRQLAVMGLFEVLRHLPFFARLWRRVRKDLRAHPPALVIPIDYPGFNLRLARFARERSIPVLYFIAPQVWAWHRSRMRQLAENVDRLAVILPFEEELFREAGAPVTFVGHPLLDLPVKTVDRNIFCRTMNLDPARTILGLFPGSRLQEVKRHLPLFVLAAHRVRAHHPRTEPVIAAAPGINPSIYKAAGVPHTTNTAGLLQHAQAALVKSGTTTLQTGLAGVPMAVTYQMNPLTFRVARRVVDVPHVALVNLVADERIVPELIQDAATVRALAAALVPFMSDTPERRRVCKGLARVRERLRGSDDGKTAAERVADLAAELVERAP